MITRCTLCPGTNACLEPDGPGEADILFIGEAPGAQENRKGRVFIGKTGDEVNRHYLPLAGLRRDRVLFTNAIRCFPVTPGGKLDPKNKAHLALLDACAAHHLYPLIERLQPKLLVPLGAFAIRSLGLENYSLDVGHGIPTTSAWGIPVFPMYHPALGIHEPKKMLHIRTDWHRLRSYLSGRLALPADTTETDYSEVTDAREIADLDPTQPLAGDTESKRGGEPFCLTFSQAAGTGRLINAGRTDLLAAFQTQLDRWEAPILFHNWLYDWAVTERMGLRFPYRRIVDTMAFVYRLGNLPQGLKALAFRECGMEMQDYEDVVSPHSTERVLDYYRALQAMDWPKPAEELVQDSKTGLWKLYKPQSLSTKLKRFFTDYRKNPEKDVFKTWENWEVHHAELTAVAGEWPGMCISHVPFHLTLQYACRDTDALIRLWPILLRMKANVRHTTQERWRQ